MRPPPSPARSRTRGHRTATAPMPVMISRSGRCPWRTSRRRPSSVNLSVWVLSQAATSASTACPISVLAPLRKTSVSGSENVPGWVSSKTLVSVTRITPSVEKWRRRTPPRYAALPFQAGLPRNIRSLQRYCAAGRPDCIEEEKVSGLAYFGDPDSVERAITQLAQLHGITDEVRHGAPVYDMSHHVASEDQPKIVDDAPRLSAADRDNDTLENQERQSP